MLHNLVNIYCDGGARGNPGIAAVGVVIKNENQQILFKFGEVIGETTNNVAEYSAVIKALDFLKNKNIKPGKINFFLDSRLVVNQLNGIFKIKNPGLFNLFLKVRNLEREINYQINYALIPRAQNWEADSLVNQALNNYRK